MVTTKFHTTKFQLKKYINCDGDLRPTDLFCFKPFIRRLITVHDISRFKGVHLFSMPP